MKRFFCLRLWIPVCKIEDPLERMVYRMQIFWWVKKSVYLPVSEEKKRSLKMISNPEKREPMNDEYFLKHKEVYDKDGGLVKATQYRGSSMKYLRHNYINAGSEG